MFDLNEYLRTLLEECRAAFGDRLLYAGLQGSYERGEAREDSDIDVMIIIDQLSVHDMDVYKEILERAGYSEKACGFICGRDEMLRWDPLEVFDLKHTTKDLFGSLSGFLPEASRRDEINYVKISLGNLYHELCHRYIHADTEENIRNFRITCKGLVFLIRDLHYLESGTFVTSKKALKQAVSEDDLAMLKMAELPDDYDFREAFSSVFDWVQAAFRRAAELE